MFVRERLLEVELTELQALKERQKGKREGYILLKSPWGTALSVASSLCHQLEGGGSSSYNSAMHKYGSPPISEGL